MLQSKEGCSGTSPLFKLRLTHLGDGSSLLTASWSHVLTDGKVAELSSFWGAAPLRKKLICTISQSMCGFCHQVQMAYKTDACIS